MAFSAGDFTDKDTDVDLANQSSYTTASISFLADTLYLIFVMGRDAAFVDANTPTITGTGLTWTQIATVQTSTQDESFSMFRAVPASNTTTTLTIDYASQTQTETTWSVIQIVNADVSSSGANAIVQSKTFAVNFGTSHTYDLDSTVTSGNAVVSGFSAPQGITWTVGTNETQIGISGRVVSQFNLADDDTVDAVSSVSAIVGSVAVEVKVGGITPVIATTTDPAITGTAITTLGAGFIAAQTTGAVTQEQGSVVIDLTETAWSDVSITSTSAIIETASAGGKQLKYGPNTLRVTNSDGNDDNISFVASPLADNDFVDLTSIEPVGDNRITAAGALAIGDQLRFGDELSGGGGFFVIVNADATFSFDPDTPQGSYTFPVKAFDASDETWGTEANQSVTVGSGTGSNLGRISIEIGIGIGN